MNQQQYLPKITLGTVQLGTHYGIANNTGQPAMADSHQLLEFALEHGVNTLDTARIYGNAEEVIGTFEHASQFSIISKFKLSSEALNDVILAKREAKESLKISLKDLKATRIDSYLFHKNIEQPIEKVMDVLPHILRSLKEESLIKTGGISVSSPEELHSIDDWEQISAVQVSMNLLDTRLLENGLLDQLQRRSVKVYIRSIYLQGLLLMNEDDLPPQLSFAGVYLRKIKQMAATAGKSVTDLAFSFVRDTPGVTSIVVGAETIEQLQENIRLASSAVLDQSLYDEILNRFKNIPELLITPAKWIN